MIRNYSFIPNVLREPTVTLEFFFYKYHSGFCEEKRLQWGNPESKKTSWKDIEVVQAKVLEVVRCQFGLGYII